MIIRKAYRYRLKTDSKTASLLAKAGGCTRLVWNRALDLQKLRLDQNLNILTYAQLCDALVLWKKTPELSFLKETHSQPLQQSLKDLDRAIRDAFSKKKGFPHFKKKHRNDSIRYPQGCKIEGNKIVLPKVGKVAFFHSISLKGDIKNVTVSKKGKHWYASVQTEYEVLPPTHSSSSIIGIDLGIVRFATLSDGTFYNPLNSFSKLEKRLSVTQKRLKNKQKHSRNWKKQKFRIAKMHIKIANARLDYLHKISTQISKNHAIIVIEDLRVSDMSRSARGSRVQPGENVRRKSLLNKAILDQGWHEFRRQLEYKQAWRGGKVIAIPPQYTSQACPQCHHTSAENRRTQAIFRCVKCDFLENADLVGALNILAVGQTVSACESNLIRDRKQEPAEIREEMLLLS